MDHVHHSCIVGRVITIIFTAELSSSQNMESERVGGRKTETVVDRHPIFCHLLKW